ncbi:MAG: GNAT family N-acetyltransferase, partial [Chloroflexus sp.]|nr:GNAT family N-acetyltransferase [Chloroflexus sp.]
MWPFRKPIDLNAVITRPSQPDDITAVSHLFRAASRRFSTANGNELYSAVEEGRAIVMQLDRELLATAVLG